MILLQFFHLDHMKRDAQRGQRYGHCRLLPLTLLFGYQEEYPIGGASGAWLEAILVNQKFFGLVFFIIFHLEGGFRVSVEGSFGLNLRPILKLSIKRLVCGHT